MEKVFPNHAFSDILDGDIEYVLDNNEKLLEI